MQRRRVRHVRASATRRLGDPAFHSRQCRPGLRVDDRALRRRIDRRRRRRGRSRRHVRRLAHAHRYRHRGNSGCVGGRGMLFGCDRCLRLSGRCHRGHGSGLDHRRCSDRLRRISHRRRGDVRNRCRPRRRRRDARRQEGQGIDVALGIARYTRAEVHVRLGQIGDAARTDGAHHRRFSYERAARHSDRPEMDERGRISERCLDRHRLPAGRHRSGKGHHTLRGGKHSAAARRAEVDTAVLAARVRMRVVERERPQYRPVDRPRPGAGTGDGERTRADDQDHKSPHHSSLLPI